MQMTMPFPIPREIDATRELVIDSFAGGGGASSGIQAALGRAPDFAINHDVEALAMHAANHPECIHVSKNVWQVDPLELVGNRPVGLAWFSPDCKHHSKAKGGRPVKRNIRDLAWIVVVWARRVRPRVIILENVEEFRDWGPVDLAGRPCPERRGKTFKEWVGRLRRLGYKVEWRELRACDYGAPTIRKRLFLIARRDGKPIVWPQPTHGAPDSADVKAGLKLPWRTAAEIIDWSLPCPSIFMTREEAREYHRQTGVRVNRPLAPNTMARVAKGVKRYVLDAAKPFIVHLQHGGRVRSIGDPLHTITASTKDCNLVAAPYLVPRYGERPGQEPRTRSVEEPMATVVPTANGGSLAAVHMTKFRANSVGSGADEPLHTVTANSYIQRAGGAPPHGIVAAFLAKHYGGNETPGWDARQPISTVTARDHHAVVSAGLMNLKGSDRRMAGPDAPAFTQTSGGWHQAEVRAFLVKYFGTDQDPRLEEPLHTVTTKDRFGVVMVEGEPYQIVDIGMRMLTRRELFRAQGFSEEYVIDRGRLPDGSEIPLSNSASIRMCGNSVCPPLAEALARANYVEAEASAAKEVA